MRDERRQGERRTGRRRRLTRLERVLFALVAVGLIVATATVAVAAIAVRTAADVKDEATTRQDQTCRLFERQQLQSAQRVRNTYRFLDELPPSERRGALVTAIVQSLPQAEREARTHLAPPFCNKPGVGLPEMLATTCRTDPPSCETIPPHRDFSRLLEP